jgi:chromosome segregation ATPase
MPRGVRNPVKTINDKIAEIEEKISYYQKRISKLSSQKKELLASREKAEMDALYKAIKQSGKTPMEFISELSSQSAPT